MLLAAHMAMLLIAAIAAYIDTRTGKIPNRLTLPAIAVAPLLWLVTSPTHAAFAILGILICGLPSYLMFRMGAIGGGDVKLFAALGGLGGISMGLELQIFSLIAALAFVLIAMAWRGQLQVILGNVARMVANPFLPSRHRRPLAATEMHSIRLGGAIFAGTAFAVFQFYAMA